MNYSFLTISGSVRAASVNSEVLLALENVRPENITLHRYDGLMTLPHFNPDHELDPIPTVLDWRRQLQHADGVIVSSPEYAHGVPGVLKNALDWVVGSGEFMNKPVLLLSASPNSAFVGPQLTETLTVMMGRVHAVSLSVVGKKREAQAMSTDEIVSSELRNALAVLCQSVDASRS